MNDHKIQYPVKYDRESHAIYDKDGVTLCLVVKHGDIMGEVMAQAINDRLIVCGHNNEYIQCPECTSMISLEEAEVFDYYCEDCYQEINAS